MQRSNASDLRVRTEKQCTQALAKVQKATGNGRWLPRPATGRANTGRDVSTAGAASMMSDGSRFPMELKATGTGRPTAENQEQGRRLGSGHQSEGRGSEPHSQCPRGTRATPGRAYDTREGRAGVLLASQRWNCTNHDHK